MVGNDIVDVIDLEAEAEAEETRVRFDARICRADEREAIARSSSPSRERWCHWAAKEAAYKLFKKQLPATIFSPIRLPSAFALPCRLLEPRLAAVPGGRWEKA